LQIQGKVKPLRDFFLALFFVYLGSQVRVGDLVTAWPMILAFAGFAIMLKPIACIAILGFFGFRKHTLFQTALNVSQISEFSLVVLLVGIQFGVASQFGLSIMAAAAVISIIISSILITYSDQLYKILKHLIPFAERKSRLHSFLNKTEGHLQDHVVVVGADKVGGAVVNYLHEEKIPLMVVDFNPHIVQWLRESGINIIYGDLSDPEILDSLQLETARLVISTAAGIIDNEMLLTACKAKNSKAAIVVRAIDNEREQVLKDMGADYVILPERVSGDFLVSHIKGHWPNLKFK
jgi:voltage-gated potassium channel Kch